MRYIDMARKVKLLSTLRDTVALGPDIEILPSQWSAIEVPLLAAEFKLSSMLQRAGDRYLPRLHVPAARRALHGFLGALEMALSREMTFFDTFVDILSQRHLPEMGLLLRGSDVLAFDSLNRDHPALRALERPLVYFNRGFGASTLRQGVTLSGHSANPVQTIQIPYIKIRDKLNLTSVLHEAGHAAMARLGLNVALPDAVGAALIDSGAPKLLQRLFQTWMTEVGPDFWGFCNCGVAQAWSIRDILSLTPARVFSVSLTDAHPPPYLRVLLAFDCCRQQWGRGVWDEWTDDWSMLYPLDEATPREREILTEGVRILPIVARTLLHGRFAALDQKPITSLFALDGLAPSVIDGRIRQALATGVLDISSLSPCGHLAVFSTMKTRRVLSDVNLDQLMTRWLNLLGQPQPIVALT